jgi:hypothetical protein
MTAWLVCDDGVCLYNENSLRRIKSDPPRCIKHGAILFTRTELNGMSRDEARAELGRQFRCDAA